MQYASITDLSSRQPTFSSTSYDDIVLIAALRSMARMLDGMLAKWYALPVSVAASGSLTFAGNVSADDTVTIGAKTYTFKASPASENDVDIGTTATQSAINLLRAVNEGTNGGSYHADTTINTEGYASRSDLVLTITARKYGPEGNDVALSTTASNITASAAYLSGGLREFDILIQLNIWLATIALLAGSANSAKSSGGKKLIDDIKEMIKTALEAVSQSGGLIDETGTTRAVLEGSMLTDGTDGYPFADSSDPVNWAFWNEMEFDRD